MRRTFTVGSLLAAAALFASDAEARPVGPQAFCQAYPTSPACGIGLVECTYCHVRSEIPATWNPYGEALRQALGGATLTDDAFRAALPDALTTVADLDSDGDGTANEQEIFGGTLPGDATSLPSQATCPADPTKYDYHVCQVDYRYLLKKVSIDFCGYTPTMEELDAIGAVDAESAKATVDATLDACMQGEHFRGPDGVLWKLAHRKIKPLSSIKSGAKPGVIPLADYDADYALFVYTQIDGHDARELLTADYFVVRGPPSSDGGASKYIKLPVLDGQQVVSGRRAGMATTAWFLVTNVMFTALPRTAAAQLYRAYLGHDIARQEGLFPVPNEPKDYDAKGVAAPTCAACHSTLDPLAYPYRNYNGLGSGGLGQYIPNRIEKHFSTDAPNISQIPESGVLFGQPEADLVSLAKDASTSQDFAAATVMDYWILTFGAPPTSAQTADFAALVASLQQNGYSVAAMLHDLVKTGSYGTP